MSEFDSIPTDLRVDVTCDNHHPSVPEDTVLQFTGWIRDLVEHSKTRIWSLLYEAPDEYVLAQIAVIDFGASAQADQTDRVKKVITKDERVRDTMLEGVGTYPPAQTSDYNNIFVSTDSKQSIKGLHIVETTVKVILSWILAPATPRYCADIAKYPCVFQVKIESTVPEVITKSEHSDEKSVDGSMADRGTSRSKTASSAGASSRRIRISRKMTPCLNGMLRESQ